MNTSNMKNIVVLKDLPSNLVEEAIVFLKESENSKKLEIIDNEVEKGHIKEQRKNIKNKKMNTTDYIINEAKMLVSEYVTKLENSNKDNSYKKLKSKYNKIKNINKFLAISLFMSVAINFII